MRAMLESSPLFQTRQSERTRPPRRLRGLLVPVERLLSDALVAGRTVRTGNRRVDFAPLQHCPVAAPEVHLAVSSCALSLSASRHQEALGALPACGSSWHLAYLHRLVGRVPGIEVKADQRERPPEQRAKTALAPGCVKTVFAQPRPTTALGRARRLRRSNSLAVACDEP